MNMLKRTLLCGAILAATVNAPCRADDTMRILFIGNSYTGQTRATLIRLVEASPHAATTEMDFIAPGGKTLTFHAKTEKTTQLIAEGTWDYVVLQDQSQTPAVFPEKFQAAAEDLNTRITKAGAKTVFFQTWGHRDGDKQNRDRFPDYPSMQKALSDSYSSAAKRNGATLAPVGDTWARVRTANAELGVALYKQDGSHPAAPGAYLAACVLYKTLFGESPESTGFKGGLSAERARVILDALP